MWNRQSTDSIIRYWYSTWNIVQTKCERYQEYQSSQTEPVPGQGSAHEVADDNTQSCHHLGKWATDVSHVGSGCLMDVDRRYGDLQTCSQPQEEPAHVQLPSLGGGHQQGPAYEQAHHREGQQRCFSSDSIHEEHSTERSKQGTNTQKTACNLTGRLHL